MIFETPTKLSIYYIEVVVVEIYKETIATDLLNYRLENKLRYQKWKPVQMMGRECETVRYFVQRHL